MTILRLHIQRIWPLLGIVVDKPILSGLEFVLMSLTQLTARPDRSGQ